MYVTINTDTHGACEVFVQMGKVGGCASAQLEAMPGFSSCASVQYQDRIHHTAIERHPLPVANVVQRENDHLLW
jgi:ribonucleoside-diphosphate reductase alpha chain